MPDSPVAYSHTNRWILAECLAVSLLPWWELPGRQPFRPVREMLIRLCFTGMIVGAGFAHNFSIASSDEGK